MKTRKCLSCNRTNSDNVSILQVKIEKIEEFLAILGKQLKKNQKHLFLCSDHFSQNDFVDKKRTKLKDGACPLETCCKVNLNDNNNKNDETIAHKGI